jgi:hypothetical protein
MTRRDAFDKVREKDRSLSFTITTSWSLSIAIINHQSIIHYTVHYPSSIMTDPAVPGVSGTSKPAERPLVGGFAAAAYEAAKADHAKQMAKKKAAAAAEAPK